MHTSNDGRQTIIGKPAGAKLQNRSSQTERIKKQQQNSKIPNSYSPEPLPDSNIFEIQEVLEERKYFVRRFALQASPEQGWRRTNSVSPRSFGGKSRKVSPFGTESPVLRRERPSAAANRECCLKF
ncbi:hypothetical protein CEXT_536901 [Caerostris extrusa]|uniref:Uncharacterized protein n=1 Tax=Caerostris extrusa TaxID=172846 RepID=A0AAV4P3N8_CAEEX|nr:hypothetical protein CEXT_536901 [Caerostris extrusa]